MLAQLVQIHLEKVSTSSKIKIHTYIYSELFLDHFQCLHTPSSFSLYYHLLSKNVCEFNET